MNFHNRPARIAAGAGAVVVAGAAAMLAVAAGTASADEPGHCLQNVNIREEPDAQSRIVALCEAGTQVKLGAERDGWVRIDELGGWASKDYVKPDESSAHSDSAHDDSAHSDSSSDDHSDSGDDRHSSHDGDGSADSQDSDSLGSDSFGRGAHQGDSGDGDHSSDAGNREPAHFGGLLG
jgi:hypothetical protein